MAGTDDTPREDDPTCRERQGFLARLVPRTQMGVLDRRIEMVSAVLMALATVASAWCAYQSTRWSGVRGTAVTQANNVRIEAVQQADVANQLDTVYVAVFIQYMGAVTRGDEKFADFIYTRLPPELKTALDAWLKTRPLQNPDAPKTPFDMPDYVIPEREKAQRLTQVAHKKFREARKAGQRSDNYVLLTVIYASVLFFAGMGMKFESRRIRLVILGIGAIAFAAGTVTALSFPVH